MEIFSARDKTPITGRSATPLTLSVNTLPGSLAGLATLSLLSMILATSTWAFTTDKDSTIEADLTVTGGLSVKGDTASTGTTDALTVNGDTVTVRNLTVEGTFNNGSTNPDPGDGSTSPSSTIVLDGNDTFQIKEGGGNSILSALTNGNIGIGNFTDPLINLAIGDSDTGFKSDVDGELQIYSNNGQRMIITNSPDGGQSRIGIGDFRVPQINLAIGDDDTGLHSAGDGKLQIYSNQKARMIITDDASGMQSRIGIGDFTVPQINLAIGDDDTGLHSPEDGILQFYTNNTEKMRITALGTVQIGDSTYEAGGAYKLMVDGKIIADESITAPSIQLEGDGYKHINDFLYFSNKSTDIHDKYLGIGTDNPSARLHVNGDLLVQSGNIILDNGNFTLNNGGNINLGSDKIKLDSDGNINLGSDKIKLDSNGNIAVDESGRITLGNFTVSKDSDKTLLRVDEIRGTTAAPSALKIPYIYESEIRDLKIGDALIYSELTGRKPNNEPEDTTKRLPIDVTGGFDCYNNTEIFMQRERIPCDRNQQWFNGWGVADHRLTTRSISIKTDFPSYPETPPGRAVLDKLYPVPVYRFIWDDPSQPQDGRYGIKADDIKDDFPHLVWNHLDHNGNRYQTIDYQGFTAVLFQALKELHYRVLYIDNYSDGRLKSNIQPIENALDKLQQINGVHFDWKDPERQARESAQVGVIAQDVEAVFPELIGEGKDGYKTVDYSKLSAVLIEAVKELKQQNVSLAARLEALEAQR